MDRQQFLKAISKLPEKLEPYKYYRSQKEHWLRWVAEHPRDPEFIYNHIQCEPMLLWLLESLNLCPSYLRDSSCATLRNHMPWFMVESQLVSYRASGTRNS